MPTATRSRSGRHLIGSHRAAVAIPISRSRGATMTNQIVTKMQSDKVLDEQRRRPDIAAIMRATLAPYRIGDEFSDAQRAIAEADSLFAIESATGKPFAVSEKNPERRWN